MMHSPPRQQFSSYQVAPLGMGTRLAAFMGVTDLVFLAYWTMSLLQLSGLIQVPPSLMYKDYNVPTVIAWNWSFFPVDLVFSITGLWAINLARQGNRQWIPIAIISLCFTFVAGLMAVSYWIILRQFDLGWFLPNLTLVIWPLFFIPSLIRRAADSRL